MARPRDGSRRNSGSAALCPRVYDTRNANNHDGQPCVAKMAWNEACEIKCVTRGTGQQAKETHSPSAFPDEAAYARRRSGIFPVLMEVKIPARAPLGRERGGESEHALRDAQTSCATCTCALGARAQVRDRSSRRRQLSKQLRPDRSMPMCAAHRTACVRSETSLHLH
jgi:hypothetical protein